jgi:hypothetical protein
MSGKEFLAMTGAVALGVAVGMLVLNQVEKLLTK